MTAYLQGLEWDLMSLEQAMLISNLALGSL